MAGSGRIGILTGGGDVPGLNSVIKSVVYNATEIGCEVIGIRRGWEGLTHMKRAGDLLSTGGRYDSDYIRPLDRVNTRTIDRTGGTWLHTSRTNPSKMRPTDCPRTCRPRGCATMETADGIYDLTPLVLDNIDYLGLDYLVTIGGDDTLSYSKVLDRRGRAAHRDPQDDGQRRPGHRVLHRLLVGRDARQGADQPPAHVAGLARADRRVPHLRPRRGLFRAVHRVRHVGALRHPRGAASTSTS